MADVIGGGWLRDDAAAFFNALQNAAKDHFGYHMPVTSAGRTKAEQARLYDGWVRRLPGFSPAYPADSPYALHVVNGGSAVDVGGSFAWPGTTQHAWLKQAGPTYGFAVNAVSGEPWHIQFTLTPTVAAGGGGSTPIPKEDDVALQILAPFSNSRPNGLQDARAIVGPGFGFIFANEGDFIDICNVAGLNRGVIRQVGMKPQTDAQTLALLVKIVNIYKSASAPDPITAAKITQIVKDNSVSEAEMVKAIASVKDVEVGIGDVVIDLEPLMAQLRKLPAETVKAFKDAL